MNLKNKMKSYSFWISICGAVIVLVSVVGQICGWNVDEKIMTEVLSAVCMVLVVMGIISTPNGTSSINDIIEEIKTDISNTVNKDDKDSK